MVKEKKTLANPLEVGREFSQEIILSRREIMLIDDFFALKLEKNSPGVVKLWVACSKEILVIPEYHLSRVGEFKPAEGFGVTWLNFGPSNKVGFIGEKYQISMIARDKDAVTFRLLSTEPIVAEPISPNTDIAQLVSEVATK